MNNKSLLNKPNRIYLWWIRTFKVISNEMAKELGLKWYRNVFGDEINLLNCRSLWIDKRGHRYRVSELHMFPENTCNVI